VRPAGAVVADVAGAAGGVVGDFGDVDAGLPRPDAVASRDHLLRHHLPRTHERHRHRQPLLHALSGADPFPNPILLGFYPISYLVFSSSTAIDLT